MSKEQDNFWEQGGQAEDVSFFDMTAPETTTEDVVEAAIEDDIATPAEPAKKDAEGNDIVEEVDPLKNVSFFAEDDNESDDDDESSVAGTGDENKATVVKTSAVSTLEFLKEKGLVNYELEDGVTLTDDLAAEILEDNYEDSVDAAAADKIKGLPDFLKTVIQVALNEGDVIGTLQQVINAKKTGITKDLDMEVEANQIKVMEQNLSNLGYDAEDIAQHIEVLKDNGKLKAMSEKAKDKFIADDTKNQEAAVKRAAEMKEADKESKRQYRADIAELATTTKVAKGIVLNKKDQETLPAYIADATIKLKDGRQITPLQEAIFSIYAKGNEEKLFAVAKLFASDFDLSSVERKGESAATRTVRDTVQNNKGKNITGSNTGSSRPNKARNLADIL